MKFIGAHVSIAGGIFNAPERAAAIGAKSFAMFTKNQRQWEAKPLSENDILKFKINCQKFGFSPQHILPHDSYLINLGAKDPEKRQKSLNAFIDEVQRCNLLGLSMLNFHPGSHLNEFSEDECIKTIAHCLNYTHSQVPNVTLVIENTAGQGSNIGYTFEQIAQIISLVNDKSRIGVCLDTCHTFAAGYDLSSKETYENTMNKFQNVIGFQYLRAVHLNDAKAKCGSKLDRHHSIGQGLIGMEFFTLLMNDPRFDNIPICLETIDESIWKEEISMLYNLQNN
ncbi:MAG: deoxyribonuclease IV [Lentisphaeria bacterium]